MLHTYLQEADYDAADAADIIVKISIHPSLNHSTRSPRIRMIDLNADHRFSSRHEAGSLRGMLLDLLRQRHSHC